MIFQKKKNNVSHFLWPVLNKRTHSTCPNSDGGLMSIISTYVGSSIIPGADETEAESLLMVPEFSN